MPVTDPKKEEDKEKKPTSNISERDVASIVNSIEFFWHSRKPMTNDISNVICNVLDKKEDKDTIAIDDINFKDFVRSWRLAFEKFYGTVKNRLAEDKDKTDAQKIIKDNIKNQIKIKIGEDYELTLKPRPSVKAHLGNCYLVGVQKYKDIWPFVALITGNNKESNQKLAVLFLNFAKKPFVFSADNLKEINENFQNYDKSLLAYYCKYLTDLAILFIFIEPARRIRLDEKDNAIPNKDQNYASSMIGSLKLLRDKKITLKEVFSPLSKHVLFTKEGVSSLSKKTKITQGFQLFSSAGSDSTDENIFSYNESLVRDCRKEKRPPTPAELKAALLEPHDNDTLDSDSESEDYNKEISTKAIPICSVQ